MIMVQFFKWVNGEWIECDESELEHREYFKKIMYNSIIIISYYNDPDYDGE